MIKKDFQSLTAQKPRDKKGPLKPCSFHTGWLWPSEKNANYVRAGYFDPAEQIFSKGLLHLRHKNP